MSFIQFIRDVAEEVKDTFESIRNDKKTSAELEARRADWEKELARRELEKKLDALMQPTSYLELKDYLKQQVAHFRKNGTSMHKGYWDRRDYRFHHIAYSLMRGRTMEQIEPKVHQQNKLGKFELDKIDEIKNRCTDPVRKVHNAKG